MHGKIQSYRELKGWGIILVDFKTRLFFHVNDYLGDKTPEPGMLVTFNVEPGRVNTELSKAVNVAPVVAQAADREGGSADQAGVL
jgi:cold shock CspA family protein